MNRKNPIVERWRSVECPKCGAGVGEGCRGPSGGPVYDHSARMKKAGTIAMLGPQSKRPEATAAPVQLSTPMHVEDSLAQLTTEAARYRGRGWATKRLDIINNYIRLLQNATPRTPRS